MKVLTGTKGHNRYLQRQMDFPKATATESQSRRAGSLTWPGVVLLKIPASCSICRDSDWQHFVVIPAAVLCPLRLAWGEVSGRRVGVLSAQGKAGRTSHQSW